MPIAESVDLTTPLITKALAEPEAFSLLQLMRIINRQLANSAQPFQLVIAADPMPNNTANEISDFSWQENRALITSTESSLTSGDAAVPQYIYQALLAAFHQEDYALHDFLNMINDRYFKLYARTIEKTHLLLTDEVDRYFIRENHPQKPQRALASCIAQLTSLPGLDENKNWLGYSLMLGKPNRSQRDLQQVLSDYFSLSINIKCSKLTKHQLSQENWTRLGVTNKQTVSVNNTDKNTKQSHTGQNNQLGQGFLLGKRCWLAKQKMNITITAQSEEQLQMLSCHDAWYLELAQMSRFYLRDKTPVAIYLQAPEKWFSRSRVSMNTEETVCLGRGFYLPKSCQEQAITYLIHLVKD
ncbi:MAG: type VI secretion system baseplate subunit TssG [Colwellia sp.]